MGLKAALLSFFSDIRLYKGGIVLFGTSSYRVTGKDMRTILDTIQPGDILLRRYNNYLGSITIPGYFSHAALYAGDNRIIHMLGDGITEEDILTFMRTDAIAVVRPLDQSSVPVAISKAETALAGHIPYDYDFDHEPDKLYCTELIDYIYGYPMQNYYKDGILLPDALLNNRTVFIPVYYSSEYINQL